MKQLYLVLIFLLSGTLLNAQEPLTDKILIEFMKPGDPDAKARDYNILPWPEEAKAAAYKAAEIWASYLEITVPIRVKFGWCDNLDTGARGGAIYSYQYTDGYYYPLPLINQLVGYDMNKDVVDIICVFKSNENWYLGLEEKQLWYNDPNDPSIQYSRNSIIPTMLHEICHGIGIDGGTLKITNKVGSWGGSIAGKADIFDSFICDNAGNQLIDGKYFKNNSEELADVLTSEKIFWNGYNGTKGNGGVKVQLHAPKEWSSLSLCHIDSKYGRTINDLMSNGFGGVTSNNGMNNYYTFEPGPIVLGMLQDIGWRLKSGATANENIYMESPIKIHTSGNDIIIEGADKNEKVLICDFSGRIRYSGSGSKRICLGAGLYIVRVADKSFKVKL